MWKKRRQSQRCFESSTDYQGLEPRRCLAGNVGVTLEGSTLLILGDSAANQIEIFRNQDGGISVGGTDTTINGSTAPFLLTGSPRHLTLTMNGGDDLVQITNVDVRKSLNFFGGDGDDRLELNGTRTRYLHVDAGNGVDVIDVGSATVDKSAYFYLGNGNDVVAVDSLIVGRNFKVFGGGGDDSFVSNRLDVGRKLKINLDDGNDSALFTGQTDIGRKARINLGAGNDSLSFNPAVSTDSIQIRKLKVNGGEGDDSTVIDGNVEFSSRARLKGGTGTDGLQLGAQVEGRRKESSIETESASVDSVRDALFARLRALNIDTSIFGDTTLRSIDVTATGSVLEVNEGDQATALDDGIVLSSESELEVTGARIQLANFVSTEDEISFEGTATITGQFDEQSGVLTLVGVGTLADYQTVLRNVAYRNLSENPIVDERQITFEVDANGSTFTGTRHLRVLGVNDAPVLELSRTEVAARRSELPLTLDEDLKLTDADDSTLESVTLAITDGFEAGDDVLAFSALTGVDGQFDDQVGTLTLSGELSIENVLAVLRSVTFANNATDSAASERTIQISVSDGEVSVSSELKINLEAETSSS